MGQKFKTINAKVQNYGDPGGRGKKASSVTAPAIPLPGSRLLQGCRPMIRQRFWHGTGQDPDRQVFRSNIRGWLTLAIFQRFCA